MSGNQTNNKTSLSPRYWPLRLIFVVLFVITRLPLFIQQMIGRGLGVCLYWLGPRRRHIARINLELCFPDLPPRDRHLLLKRHFRQYGISLIETFSAWWGHQDLFKDRAEYQGIDNLHDALKQGKGVILVGSHFTTLEVGVRLLSQIIPFDMMYRPHKNQLLESTMSKGRERWGGKVIDRRDIRKILRSLKSNHPVWYGPDQDYGRKHSVFAPFMGQIAATVTGTSRIASISGAPVVPYFVERIEGTKYRIIVLPALKNFPTDNLESDAKAVNELIETQIRKSPENYLWTHRRFKTRPEGEQRPY